jgi:hypothetical protein
VLPRETIYVDSLEEALREAEAALLITRWDEFRTLPELIERRGDSLLLIDGRRMIDPAAVTKYDGIGFSGRTVSN